MKKVCLLLMCCLAVTACAKKTEAPATSPADFVAVTLGDAAETAHSELAMLAKLRGQGLQPLLPPSDPSLSQPVSIAWTGLRAALSRKSACNSATAIKKWALPPRSPLWLSCAG